MAEAPTTEDPKADDLFVICPRCNGSALEPGPEGPPPPETFNPDVFKYNLGAVGCSECKTSRRVPSPAGEALIAFLTHPTVAPRVEAALAMLRPQFGGRF
jgi:hypothetical protein